ncbi:MAG: hypothetical protein JW841_03875 [Deltaproteobacteria bacterium]|nr:hypothetical protein [Deltaproteobacteria bacterium]
MAFTYPNGIVVNTTKPSHSSNLEVSNTTLTQDPVADENSKKPLATQTTSNYSSTSAPAAYKKEKRQVCNVAPQLPNLAAINPKKTAIALVKIRQFLNDNCTLYDVTHTELLEINQIFHNLTSEEASYVFKKLTLAEREHWRDEILSNAPGQLNGLSYKEKTNLLKMMTAKLKAPQLLSFSALFINSLSTDDKSILAKAAVKKLNGQQLVEFAELLKNYDYIANFGKVIAASCSVNTKIVFIKAMAKNVNKGPLSKLEMIGNGTTHYVGGCNAKAIAYVLKSLSGSDFTAVFSSLQLTQRSEIFLAAAGEVRTSTINN